MRVRIELFHDIPIIIPKLDIPIRVRRLMHANVSRIESTYCV